MANPNIPEVSLQLLEIEWGVMEIRNIIRPDHYKVEVIPLSVKNFMLLGSQRFSAHLFANGSFSHESDIEDSFTFKRYIELDFKHDNLRLIINIGYEIAQVYGQNLYIYAIRPFSIQSKSNILKINGILQIALLPTEIGKYYIRLSDGTIPNGTRLLTRFIGDLVFTSYRIDFNFSIRRIPGGVLISFLEYCSGILDFVGSIRSHLCENHTEYLVFQNFPFEDHIDYKLKFSLWNTIFAIRMIVKLIIIRKPNNQIRLQLHIKKLESDIANSFKIKFPTINQCIRTIDTQMMLDSNSTDTLSSNFSMTAHVEIVDPVNRGGLDAL